MTKTKFVERPKLRADDPGERIPIASVIFFYEPESIYASALPNDPENALVPEGFRPSDGQCEKLYVCTVVRPTPLRNMGPIFDSIGKLSVNPSYITGIKTHLISGKTYDDVTEIRIGIAIPERLFLIKGKQVEIASEIEKLVTKEGT